MNGKEESGKLNNTKCCVWGCDSKAEMYDTMDNPWCEECAIQNVIEEPENWEREEDEK